MTDTPPPNGPRVLQDGQLQIEQMTVPVLISGNQRLIVLSSECIKRMAPGQTGLLAPNGQEPQLVTVSDIDDLALIVRYEFGHVQQQVQQHEPQPEPDEDLELPEF